MIENEQWPALPLEGWLDTHDTLHMWLQMVGKVRLQLTPKENHWWNAALYLTSRGLTTSPIRYQGGAFEIQFDFVDHRLAVYSSGGHIASASLRPQSVSAFYHELMAMLNSEGVQVEINEKPQEIPNPILFEQDDKHASYDRDAANRFWRILLSTRLVLDEFRAKFIGKCSPVHFFWGSMDLACTRFNGRRAPARKGVITGEAYSHECSSAGWWPGSPGMKDAAFYSYMAPVPEGFSEQIIRPSAASYDKGFGEFLMAYDDLRRSTTPHEDLLNFFQTSYEAGANLAGWDRPSLER